MARTYEHTHNGIEGEIWQGDSDGKTLVHHRYQDVKNILKENKAKRNEFSGYNSDKSMLSVAEIPQIILYQWLKDDQVFLFSMQPDEQHKYLQKKLNDPQWAYLRTSEGTY